jgi:hypothetical protein
MSHTPKRIHVAASRYVIRKMHSAAVPMIAPTPERRQLERAHRPAEARGARRLDRLFARLVVKVPVRATTLSAARIPVYGSLTPGTERANCEGRHEERAPQAAGAGLPDHACSRVPPNPGRAALDGRPVRVA